MGMVGVVIGETRVDVAAIVLDFAVLVETAVLCVEEVVLLAYPHSP